MTEFLNCENFHIYQDSEPDIDYDSDQAPLFLAEQEQDNEKPPDQSNIFVGNPLDDFAKNAIVGNFKLPHSKAPDIFNWLKKTTAGQVILTLEIGEKEEKNEHLHFAISDSKVKPDSLKTYIRKSYPELVNTKKGGDKKYCASYAKTVFQVYYIFKERINYYSNIDFLQNWKPQHMSYYYEIYKKMSESYSKCPAGQFYEWLNHHYPASISTKFKQPSSYKHCIRTELVKFVTEYSLKTDNPNPGVPYYIKLINYAHIRLDQDSFNTYMENKIRYDIN